MVGKGDRNRSSGKEFKEKYEKLYGKKCTFNHEHTKECEGYEDINTSSTSNNDE